MYTEFYGLSRMPFQLMPDSSFFFGSAEHTRAMAFLNYGISQGEGFVVITGEVGAGKTTLVDRLLSTLDHSRYVAGKVVTTQLSSHDMLRMVGASLKISADGIDKATLLHRLELLIGELHGQAKRIILIIDEAQSLTKDALEELRMLSNIVVPGAPPLQSILLGQPEFRAILSSPDFEQMRQRVTASCHLGALNAVDTRRYVEHRLVRAGWSGDPSFSDKSFDEVFRFTAGLPRRINTLCSRLLLLGFLEERHQITEDMVAAVATELEAELGPLAGGGAKAKDRGLALQANGPASQVEQIKAVYELRESVLPRIERIEQKMDQHEKALTRALDLVIQHLAPPKSLP